MVEERIDIQITDKVSPGPAKKLREIATEAIAADTALTRLRAALTSIDDSALTRLANASARLTNAHAREVAATARLETARAKMVTATARAALEEQRLATEATKTEAAQQRAATATAQAAAAAARAEAASLRLAAAKARETTATDAATGAQQRNSAAMRAGAASTGLASHQLGNMIAQVQDVGVSLAGGQNPLIVLVQQGSQIASIYGPGTGLTTIMRGFGQAIFSIAAQFAPVLAAVGVVAAGFGLLTAEINKTTDVNVKMRDTFKATAQLIGESIYSVIKPAIDFLAPYFKQAYDAVLAATKFVVNGITGAFVGTYSAIVGTWDMLPDVFRDVMAMAVNGLIDVVNGGVGGILDYFRDFINSTVGVFTGGFNAVTGVWGLLPDAFHDLGVAAMNGIIQVVQSGVNGLISAVGSFLEWLGSAFSGVGLDNPFAGLLDNATVDLSAYQGELRGAGQQISTTISDAFTEAFSRDYAEGMKQSLDLSSYRQDVTGAARDAAEVVNNAYRDAFTTDFAGSAFEAIWQRSIKLAQERIAAENEADKATGASNASLSRKMEILQEIRKPLTEYLTDTQALNELFAEGAITAGQYAQALASLSLVTQLRDVDSSLTAGPYSDSAAIDEIRIAEQERLNIVQMALEARILSEEEAMARIVEINRQAAIDVQEIEAARNSMILTNASDTFGSLADAARGFAGEQSAIYRGLFIASKAFAIADSIMKIQQGLANAMALPFPANLAAYATVAAQSASIVSNIQAVQFADGGRVTGPGGPRDDKILARVSNGEYVVNARATARNLPLLEAINDGRDQVRYTPQFADGGRVQASAFSAETPRVGNVPQVNVNNNPTVRVYTRDPDTRVEFTNSQNDAATARRISRGQRNL